MEFLRQLQLQILNLWRGMSMPRRMTFIALLLGSAGALVAVGYWANQPNYGLLFAGLTAEDAAAVKSKLQGLNVPFKLSSGGTSILVPLDQVQDLRVDLAADGLPSREGKGLESLNESPLGMTPYLQNVNHTRAIQVELARSIMKLGPISEARVIIAKPDSSPFIRDQKLPTASVVVGIKPGSTLSLETASAIVATVAAGVEGLKPENVTLVDNKGRLYTDHRGGEAGNMPSNHLNYKQGLEAMLASRAEELLTRSLGPGRAVVRVTAEVDFKQLTETKESFSPEDRTVTMEKISNKKTSAPSSGARGPTGFNAQVKPAGAAGGNPAESKDTEELIESTYIVPKTLQKIEDRVSKVTRLTVAAMVDLSQSAGADAGGTPLAVKDVEAIIKQAVGFSDDRDKIEVRDVKLIGVVNEAEVESQIADMRKWQNYLGLARNGSLGLGALVALVLGVMYLRRLRATAAPAAPSLQGRDEKLERLAAAAQQDPELVARFLAAWLEEEKPPLRQAA